MNFTSLQTRARFFYVLFLLIFSCAFFIGPHYVFADTIGPAFTSVFPADEVTVSSSKVTISVRAEDPDKVQYNSIIMMVDGVLVNPIKQYGWTADYVDDPTLMDIYYSTNLIEGNHTVTLTAADWLGNSSTKEWSFTVSQPPTISPIQPGNNSTVSELRPTISARVTDNTAVDPNTVEMYLAGQKVNAVFDEVYGELSYTPESSLNNETNYTVQVRANDLAGNIAEVSWAFFINSFGEMDSSNDDTTCQQCHQRTEHPMNNCRLCHGTNVSTTNPSYPLDDCYECHYNSTNYPVNYHDNGLPISDPPLHGAVDTDSCVECHGKSWSTAIPPLHTDEETSDRHTTTSIGCTDCHAATLTREHVGRYDSNGKEITCFTCHNSSEQNVQQAITNKDLSCNACHQLGPNGGHPQHNNGLDAACQTCHSNSILTEQQFHETQGCNLCHKESATEIVKYAIQSQNTSCTACHTEGHNNYLIGREPVDIPKYPGFTWNAPQSTLVWASEPWMPADFITVGSKLIISSRRSDLTGTELLSWYEQQMGLSGWEKLNGPTEAGNYMVLSYQKDTRYTTIIIYNGEYHSGNAPVVGYRVEILYK